MDLLLLRLETLSPLITKFILIESDKTFTGLPKILHWRDIGSHQPRFLPYLPQISSHVLTNLTSTNPWINEYTQRDMIGTHAKNLGYEDDDILIVSDVDEIPNPERIKEILKCSHTFPLTLRSTFHYYYYEYVKPTFWYGIQVINLGLLEEMEVSEWRRNLGVLGSGELRASNVEQKNINVICL
ncbi:hypothetical protein TL16_g09468 [Triparma laevis f. inornata]|uniref:Uncharacterized protein n=1 Tax=Triparma laevis f. inornata TaxID=1714386 RepID=A0A9W7BAU8_9STRA|nr:hypothetical protein TL16_g09468 [Triparma laevis f. inornata]